MLIKNAKAFINGNFTETDIRVADGKIADIAADLTPVNEKCLDLKGDYLLPGFVDVHIHAFKGYNAMNGEEDVRGMSRELRKVGVAAFCPTTMSASEDETIGALAGIHAVMDNPEPDGAAVLGAHMEAPFLNASKAGAQLTEYFCLPTEENFQLFTGVFADIVRLITIAPELPSAMDLIKKLSSQGITVSIGHTAATAEIVHEAGRHGANHITHLFNAMSPLHHREPGVPGAALTDSRFFCELIADGIHLHPDIVKLTAFCKGQNQLVAITDAMEAAGMPDGQYTLGGQEVFVQNRAARLSDGTLAGSTLMMADAFTNMIRFGINPEIAAAAVTSTPASSIGEQTFGVIQKNAPAVFVRFDENWQFVQVIV